MNYECCVTNCKKEARFFLGNNLFKFEETIPFCIKHYELFEKHSEAREKHFKEQKKEQLTLPTKTKDALQKQ